MEKKLFIHIGRAKTGTTSIQQFLSLWGDSLRDHGFKYASTGLFNSRLFYNAHHPLVWSIVKYLSDAGLGRYWESAGSYAKVEQSDKAYWTRLRQEILQGDMRSYIVSSEEFSVHTDLKSLVPRVRELVGDDIKVIIVCFVRSQDRYLESTYNQAVKAEVDRISERFTDYVRRMIEVNAPDFNKTIDPWADEFGKESLRIVDFDEARKHSSIVNAFLDVIGWEGERDKHEVERHSNQSFSRFQIEFLRILNKHKKIVNNRTFSRFVWFFSKINRYFKANPSFLSEAERENIRNIYRLSNERFREKYADQIWKCKD